MSSPDLGQAHRLHRRPAMKLHGVFEHVELMPARFWNENIVRILAQRFIGTVTEEGLELAIDMQNLEPRVIMIGSGAAFKSCSRKFDGELCSDLAPRLFPGRAGNAERRSAAPVLVPRATCGSCRAPAPMSPAGCASDS